MERPAEIRLHDRDLGGPLGAARLQLRQESLTAIVDMHSVEPAGGRFRQSRFGVGRDVAPGVRPGSARHRHR